MKKYAVASTMVKTIPSGLNLVTDLRFIEAENEHEAMGICMEQLSDCYKEHYVHIKPVAGACS